MTQKPTLKQKWLGTKIASVVTLIFSILALQSIGQEQVVYSEFFEQPDNDLSECVAWTEFSDQLTPDKNYLSVLFKGSRNEEGLLLESPERATELAAAIHNSENIAFNENGQFWTVYDNNGSAWVGASSAGTEHHTGSCYSGPDMFNIRACLENNNFGGINGPSCGATSQRMDLIFTYGGLNEVENITATCPESADGSLTVNMTVGVAPYTFEWSNGIVTTSGQTIDGFDLLGHFEEKSYYRGVNQFPSYDEANEAAALHHGSLVIVDNTDENAWLLANGVQENDVLGGTDQDSEGTWYWPNGEPFSAGYTNWITGEPNNSGGNEDYIAMRIDGTWNDISWNHNVSVRQIFEFSAHSRIDNLAPGDYTVTVTDAEGSVISGTYTIGPDPIAVSIDMTQASTCDEISDGAATANVTGGTVPYTYSWDSGEEVAGISNKAIGEYTVTVTDANACNPAVETVNITPNDAMAPVATAQNIDVYLDDEGTVSISAEDVDEGSSDDCALTDLSIDVSNFSCEDVSTGPATFDGNTAIGFDGADDRIDFDATLPFAPDHTIATWIKMDASQNGAIFTWGSPVVNNYTAFLVQSGRIRYITGDGNPSPPNVAGSTFIGDNEWHHVAISRNASGDINLYLDGSLEATGNLTQHVINPTQTSIGGGLFNGSFALNLDCQLDEFAFWTEALSQEEIQNIQCSGVQGAQVLFNFENGAGTNGVIDQTGNANSATLQNMDSELAWTAFGEPKMLTACSSGKKVVLTATDAAGNTAEADAYVTVNDTISPDAAARTRTIQLDENGNAIAVAEDFDNESTDNCGIEGFALSKTTYNCNDLGSTDVVLTVTDIHGNSKSIETQVTVEDNLAPSLAVQNIEVSLDANGVATIATEDVEVSSSDNCAVASKALNIESFTCEDMGEPVTVEMTVADASGNETTESFTVTVVDEEAPSIPEALSIDLYLDGNGEAEFDTAPFLAEASDNCGLDAIVVADIEGEGITDVDGFPFTCENLGVSEGPLMVRDQSGNLTGFMAEISVIDTIKPVIPMQTMTVQLDANGAATIDVETAPLTASDNCGIASRSLSQTEFSCEDLGWNDVIFSVADASGNQRQVTVEVLVEDNVAPVIAESLDMNIFLDEDGLASFDSEPLLAEAADNCGLDAIAFQIESTYIDAEEVLSFDCSSVGPMTEILYATDTNGNGTPFTLNMTVIDTIKPSFNLNAIELQVDAEGMATLSEEMLTQYAADNCGVAEVAIQTEQFDCSQIGDTQFTEIIVFDLHGNAKQQTLEVQLIDAIAPQVQVEDITVELGEDGLMNLNVDLLEMMIIENCEPTDFVLSQTEFTCADLGSTEQSITVTDASGNSGEAEFTLTVVDNASPEISGPQIIDVCQGVPVSYAQIVAVDNCSAELNVIDGPQTGDTPEAGEFMVEFEAVDPSGNTTSAVIMLAVYPTAEVDLGEDMEVDEGTEITLIAGESNNNTYFWSDGSTDNMYQFVATEDVTVTVEVITPEGCSVTDEINITIGSFLGVDEDANGNSVRFFPNPTQGQLSIALSLTEVTTDVQINVTDISGKSVVQQLLPTLQNGDVISLDLSSFAKGIYLINLQSETFNLTERVVKH